MKYEFMSIDKHDAGNTVLLLKDRVFVEFAVIPWKADEKTQLFLHPENVRDIPDSTNIHVGGKDTMPIFTRGELNTVVATVKQYTTRIQAQRRQPFRYVDRFEKVASVTDLVVQAVVTPGEKTNEGLLIEAVTIPWFEIIELLNKNPKLAFEIPPRKWEEIIAGAYKKAGFEEVTLTPASGDLGRDVIAVKRGLGSIRVVDQVKAYKPGHLVKANDVRALVGVLKGDKASKAFLTTTSDFAPKIREDPLINEFIPASLELINGKALLKRLEELAAKKR